MGTAAGKSGGRGQRPSGSTKVAEKDQRIDRVLLLQWAQHCCLQMSVTWVYPHLSPWPSQRPSVLSVSLRMSPARDMIYMIYILEKWEEMFYQLLAGNMQIDDNSKHILYVCDTQGSSYTPHYGTKVLHEMRTAVSPLIK